MSTSWISPGSNDASPFVFFSSLEFSADAAEVQLSTPEGRVQEEQKPSSRECGISVLLLRYTLSMGLSTLCKFVVTVL